MKVSRESGYAFKIALMGETQFIVLSPSKEDAQRIFKRLLPEKRLNPKKGAYVAWSFSEASP